MPTRSVTRSIARPSIRAITTPFYTTGSLAALLAAGEAQALAIVFTDNFFLGASGAYGSAYVKDTGTPANNYNSHPYGLLTYTSPSAKMTMGPTGTLRFGAHNLYLNSASPANQSITVTSGATYAIDITGSVSVTASGAATGTWTVGTTTFTAATGTLTLGSTSGSGTVCVRRTPSDSTYLATTASARYALPYEWDTSGVLQGILVEEARTNLALQASDLTNASWTKTTMTTALTATGPDGVANSATTCTASAGNATALQAITSGSAARITSVWLKRRTGTGNVDLTQDNGTTWTTQTITSSWARYSLTSVTSANPTIGIRLVTNGDAVDVAIFQHELGAFITSSIPTTSATVTRAADNISVDTTKFPTSTSQTFFAELYPLGIVGSSRIIGVQTSNTPIYIQSSTAISAFINPNALSATVTALANRTAKAAFANDGSAAALCADAGTVQTGAFTVAAPTSFYLGANAGGNCMTGYLRKILYVPRKMTNGELQTRTT
jgi:hypothetical protein